MALLTAGRGMLRRLQRSRKALSFASMPSGVIGASSGAIGTAGAQSQLRGVFEFSQISGFMRMSPESCKRF
ncbi:MAG: hypothetical protein JNM98_07560 [Rhodocyclaceae bacterium]|nr:hypothetical protein [Rhodocyclaceae bacterium]